MSEIKYAETNSETIQNNLISYFEEYTGEPLGVGDARRQLLQGMAYILAVIKNDINETAKQNLLRYAVGDVLRELGVLVGVQELPPEPSNVMLKFALSSVMDFDVSVPEGTRATADGNIFFATDEDLIIEKGSTEGIISATATVAGAVGNGLLPGQINNIVDGVPYVMSVVNTTTSINGRDTETDDELRERIRNAPYSFSTAGSEGAYRYLAMSANANVGDADPIRAEAGRVNIYIVKKDGTLPEVDDEIINDVLNACNAKNARPLTDYLTVKPAEKIESSINVTYYISKEDDIRIAEIKKAVEGAVNDYVLWQTTKIGRDINPNKLRNMMMNAGASDVDILSPVKTVVEQGAVAQFSNKNISYGGETE